MSQNVIRKHIIDRGDIFNYVGFDSSDNYVDSELVKFGHKCGIIYRRLRNKIVPITRTKFYNIIYF